MIYKHTIQGRGVGNYLRPMPNAPTTAIPGTTSKLVVLEERARLEQQLWHPQDAKIETDTKETAPCLQC